MAARRVLVAFASHLGSTAAIAEVIAAELRASGLDATCVPASEVASLSGVDALVLGSGVFVRRRATDGGGFLAHHADELRGVPLWLFTAGPIGADHDRPVARPAVDAVAQAVGARGSAAFGAGSMDRMTPDFERPVDMRRVRAWAQEIARGLGVGRFVAAS